MTRTLDPTGENRPTGPMSGLMYEYSRQIHSVKRHAAAEGTAVSMHTTLTSYDRTLHPWLHGRRPEDLLRAARRGWTRLCDRLSEVTDD